jgi:hypothetical protein
MGRAEVFGGGRPRPLDRNAKARIMHLARAMMRPIDPGRYYGPSRSFMASPGGQRD